MVRTSVEDVGVIIYSSYVAGLRSLDVCNFLEEKGAIALSTFLWQHQILINYLPSG
ncbi:hypothetical protein [Anabaena sp. FACHB-83]|uniref:hypothetical protein n=1 Tax=Anabaena sp. FACHB-83 TaxID=2692772 RepID=UPI00168AFE38|nr:hypothetical protein [Anabaena sp. FACHB-83]MBD2479476.1 hypothetical protein [Anabaena sp. FACHB-83]